MGLFEKLNALSGQLNKSSAFKQLICYYKTYNIGCERHR